MGLDFIFVFIVFTVLCIESIRLDPAQAVKFCSLKNCRHEFATEYKYRNWYNLEKITGAKNSDGEIKLTLYVLGNKDANIILSSLKYPKNGDPCYEFGIISYITAKVLRLISLFEVVGGSAGIKNGVHIRTRKAEEVYISKSLTSLPEHVQNEVSIEINKCGTIKITVNQAESLYHQSDKLDVRYLSFASWNRNHVNFYFNCTTYE